MRDCENRLLMPVAGPPAPLPRPLRIDGTFAGRAYRTQGTQRIRRGGGDRIFVPVLDASERLGALDLDQTLEVIDAAIALLEWLGGSD